MSLVVRLATGADIPELRELIPASARGLSDGYSERQIERALGAVFGVDSQLIADGTFYVAEWDGRIAGCGGWSKRRTLYGGDEGKQGPDELLDPATDPAKIRAFFVHPDYGRRGIGRALIEACEAAAWAAGFRRMVLGATPAGERLYARAGYVVTDRFEIALDDGEVLPASHMEKDLTAPPQPIGSA
ncbi:MAG: GNAT family N-acetyltransferase [Thermomicrobiales bacterium]|nr:GNAT family N-acetyltransferase [Thermomicrobiales bacterium]